jgi:putative tricarboxylic transport membrane protein
MLIAGVIGFLMLRHGFGPAPLVMGLILGKLVEESFSQSMILLDNQWWRLFESNVVIVFFILTVLGLGWPFISAWMDRRQQAAAVATEAAGK